MEISAWTKIAEIAGPVGIVVIIFLAYVRILGARIDAVTDRYITALEDLVSKNQATMNIMVISMQEMTKALKDRVCMARLGLPDLEALVEARKAEIKEKLILKVGGE